MPRRIISQKYTPCIPILTKNVSFDFGFLPLPSVDCPAFSGTFVGNSGDGGRIPPES